VVVHYCSNQTLAEETVAAIRDNGGEAVAVSGDLADPTAAARVVAGAADRLGPIAILVNNAGEMTDGPVESMSDETWERALSVNLTGTFRCARECLPAMRRNGWGRIINVSSQAAYTGSAEHAHYAASKSGLLGLTFSLAKEVGQSGITVNLVSPGRIRTDLLMERSAGREEEWMRQTPLRRFGEPDEVAAAIVFLASDAASYITGATLHVNGGLVMD
jgi:NAD(P)-dependent dehydrogenase (short-subunit alcohol dehydrogenase family)